MFHNSTEVVLEELSTSSTIIVLAQVSQTQKEAFHKNFRVLKFR